MADLTVTNFEMNEIVFVPAGDGHPAQSKPKGDLSLAEVERYSQDLREKIDQHTRRVRRFGEIADDMERRAEGRGDLTAAELLNVDELDELETLSMTIAAHQREFDKRKAAIDRDIAAGRYYVIRTDGEEGRPVTST